MDRNMLRGHDAAFKDKVSREAGNSQPPQYGNIAGKDEFVFVKGKGSI